MVFPEQILQKVGPLVWDSGVPGKANTVQPVPVHLKTGTAHPHRKQYPTKQEALECRQHIIDEFITHRLLVPCQSPAILPVLKLTEQYRLVQDLRLVNEAVIPLHPLVANSYTILTQVLDYTPGYTVLDLKDALFCRMQIPNTCLHLSGQTPKQWPINSIPGRCYHRGLETAPIYSREC